MKKQLYIAVHSHKYGISTYPVLSDHFPTISSIVEVWSIDFEPDKEEFIDIELAGKPRIIK